jgi:AmmeMemoRadiSam system protein B/AmmeMemoRadiSam system protein A
VKAAAVAGTFYASDGDALAREIAELRGGIRRDYDCHGRAVIAPHAGYAYSGKLAAAALQYLNPAAGTAFVFAPAHRVAFEGIAVCDYANFATPLGNIATNSAATEELIKNFNCKIFNEAFESEHAIEVQLPLLKTYSRDIKIVPLLVGDASPSAIDEILAKFWVDPANVFIISSDLSHFHDRVTAAAMDCETCGMIESCQIEKFSPQRACGSTSICGLVKFAAGKDFAPIRIGYHNSGDITGDGSSVVGYGAWLLVECPFNKFISDHCSAHVLSICRRSIESALGGQSEFTPKGMAPVFDQFGASFVTLEIGGNLRGCIGSTAAHRPLGADLAENAKSAAFHDVRFMPLTADELEKITIAVSLLSKPSELKFSTEEELIDQLVVGVDGLIIGDGFLRAVYLPCVWEQLPDRREFLASLKAKAGMARNHFSKTFRAQRFRSEYIR